MTKLRSLTIFFLIISSTLSVFAIEIPMLVGKTRTEIQAEYGMPDRTTRIFNLTWIYDITQGYSLRLIFRSGNYPCPKLSANQDKVIRCWVRNDSQKYKQDENGWMVSYYEHTKSTWDIVPDAIWEKTPAYIELYTGKDNVGRFFWPQANGYYYIADVKFYEQVWTKKKAMGNDGMYRYVYGYDIWQYRWGDVPIIAIYQVKKSSKGYWADDGVMINWSGSRLTFRPRY